MVNKLLQGRSDDIRPCVGANYCINRIYAGAESLCVHNPATGREATMPQILRKADAVRRIVVVGGGPGGLEAARVCAARGHAVVLFEAEPECGGQIRAAAELGWRRRLGGITDWLVGQCRTHGVDLRTSVTADRTAVLTEQPDVVIVATGGVANKGPIEGAEFAVTSWDILTGKVAPGERVLLFDDHGDDRGLACAQFLVERGAALEMATPERQVGIDVGGTTFSLYLRALYEKGAKLSPDRRLRAVRREGNALVAELRNEYTLAIETREVDQVVAEHGTLPRDELYFALKPLSRNHGEVDYHALVGGRPQAIVANPAGGFLLYRVGDAVTSRNIHSAIFDSLRLCHDI
jgi:NADPH-dependent 2,4-dienoyl-CoA reductase/sulfur reductase-like enzyme